MDRLPDFESYKAATLARGFDEVLERRWAPGTTTGTHSHPFDVTAVVVEGELWLEQGPIAVRLLPGSEFELKANVPHCERYGPEGAVFYSGRKHVEQAAA